MIRLRWRLLEVLSILSAIFLWFWLSSDSSNPFFPSLKTIVEEAINYWLSPAGLSDIQSTLTNIFIGLAIGSFSAIIMTIALSQLHLLRIIFQPLIELLRTTPNVMLLPITISMFGIGNEMKQVNIAIAAFCPVLITTLEGYQQFPKKWRETADVFSLPITSRILFVTLPGLLPSVLTGMHIALPLTIITSITSEMVGETRGIGSVILSAQYSFDITRMWSGVILLALIGYVLNFLFNLLRAKIVRRI